MLTVLRKLWGLALGAVLGRASSEWPKWAAERHRFSPELERELAGAIAQKLTEKTERVLSCKKGSHLGS